MTIAPRAKLAHLEKLVAQHETYWGALQQSNPRSSLIAEFLRDHWDPWFSHWLTALGQLHRRQLADAQIAAWVAEAAQGLSWLRYMAAYNGISTPDLGTAEHGIVPPSPPLVAETSDGTKVSGPADIGYDPAMTHDELPADQVGHWFLPLALGVPAGALGGYYYRKWQEANPGKTIPFVSGDPSVGGPWVDIVGKAAVQSPAAPILVPVLSEDGQPTGDHAMWHPTRDQIVRFGGARPVVFTEDEGGLFGFSLGQPGAYAWHAPTWTVRYWDQANGVAFVPDHLHPAPQLAAVSGAPWVDIVGSSPWVDIVGADPALAILRRQAEVAAEEMPGNAVGVRRDATGAWELKSFVDADAADDWYGHAISSRSSFTYAAYFSKDHHGVPFLEHETVGGQRRRHASPGERFARDQVATVTVRP